MMKVLRVIDSQGIPQEYSLSLQEGEQLSFGRSSACDISQPEESNISRVHCHFICRGGRIFIRDNASVNGVYCNGVAIVEAEMHPGQEFVLGLCTLSLEDCEEEAPPPEEQVRQMPEVYIPTPAPPPAVSVPLREPLPVSAASVPLREPLPVSAAAVAAPAPVVPPPRAEMPVQVSVRTRRPAASVVPPRRLIHAEAPALPEKKQLPHRKIRTAAPADLSRKKKRRLSVPEQTRVEASELPVASSGAVLGLPADFNVQISVQVPRYPLREEDILALTAAAEEKCYVAVVQYDAAGAASLIVPGSERENTVVYPHVLTRFPRAAGADYELVVEPPFGPVRLVLLACTVPVDWAASYASALELLGPAPVPGAIESAMLAAVPASVDPPRRSSATLVLFTSA